MTDRSQTERRRRQPASHLFRIGQIVRMTSRFGVSPDTADFYRIIATLPPRDNALQYRVRSDAERHERVVTQDILEAADLPTTGNGATLIEGHSAMAKGQKRSNREIRKPKQEKAAPKPETSFSAQIKSAANTNAPRRTGGN